MWIILITVLNRIVSRQKVVFLTTIVESADVAKNKF